MRHKIEFFCDQVLVLEDHLDFEKNKDVITNYIEEFIENPIDYEENRQLIRLIVQEKILSHIAQCRELGNAPFEFASDNEYYLYRLEF